MALPNVQTIPICSPPREFLSVGILVRNLSNTPIFILVSTKSPLELREGGYLDIDSDIDTREIQGEGVSRYVPIGDDYEHCYVTVLKKMPDSWFPWIFGTWYQVIHPNFFMKKGSVLSVKTKHMLQAEANANMQISLNFK